MGLQRCDSRRQLYLSMSQARERGDIVATYSFVLPSSVNVDDVVERFAVGQTLGTWTEIPGITDVMRRDYQGKIVSLVSCPPDDLSVDLPQEIGYILRIAIPAVNVHADLSQLLVTCLGNDASTSMQAKLVDLELPEDFIDNFPGPKFGISGLREWLGVFDRPLVLNMIKPCTGLTPRQGAEIFYQTAIGGVDLIKDDELMGDTSFSPLVDRVKAYEEAANKAEQESGHRTIYVPNITAQGTRLLKNAERALEAGAKALMISYGAVGYGMLNEVASTFRVPILAHYAGSNMFFEGRTSGMSAGLAAGLMPRIAGADMALVNTPYGGYPLRRTSYQRVFRNMILEMGSIRRTMPVIGGGVSPMVVDQYLSELGQDIILAPGGAIQGHPDGPAAGVKAMFQAIEAWQQNVQLEDYATGHIELANAIRKFGNARGKRNEDAR